MIELNDLLPQEQWEDNWTFFGDDHDVLPDDAEYVIFEYYCATPGCDCQEVVAEIKKLDKAGKPQANAEAVIRYGWPAWNSLGKAEFDETSPQTAVAQKIMEIYKVYAGGGEYLDRIKSQYARVKELVAAGKTKRRVYKTQDKRVGRNDPCTCGSGKKYKKCCYLAIE